MTRPRPVDTRDLTLPEVDRRVLTDWAVGCAKRLLPIFEEEGPQDPRLRLALDQAREFTAGMIGVGQMRSLAFTCHEVAREASSPPEVAVARAAGQALSVAHMAGHSREIARYTAKALTGEELIRELAWQRDHLLRDYHEYVYGAIPGR